MSDILYSVRLRQCMESFGITKDLIDQTCFNKESQKIGGHDFLSQVHPKNRSAEITTVLQKIYERDYEARSRRSDDKEQVLFHAGHELFLATKQVYTEVPYTLLTISYITRNLYHLVDAAFIIYHSLDSGLAEKTPLEILKCLVNEFGIDLERQGRVARFFAEEVMPASNLVIPDEWNLALAYNIPPETRPPFQYKRKEFCTYMDFEYSDRVSFLGFVLDLNRYRSWVESKGQTSTPHDELSRIRDYTEKNIVPRIADKSFMDKVYILVHDFCFYCREHPKALGILAEQDIRDLFLIVVKTALSTGEGEAFHYDGKLDFKIVNPDNKYEIYTGEFKWWHGESSAKELFHQAVRKHATGQEAAIFTVILSKTKDAQKVFEAAKEIFLAQKETVPETFKLSVPTGSKELVAKCLVLLRNAEITLSLNLANLYYENV